MTGSRRAQVLVVGGGPGGAATACFLAQAGVDVALVDRARFPRDKTCAEYLSPEASRLLQAMGALGDVERAGAAQLSGMRVRAPGGAVIDGRFAAGHGFRGFRDRGLALRRRVLDALLLERARSAGVRIVEGAQVTGLDRDVHGRVTGAQVLEDGVPEAWRADVVVGADGLRSVVARRLALARHWPMPRRLAIVAHYRGVAGMGDQGEMFVESDGYVGLAPVEDGLVNVAIVVPATRGPELVGDAAGFMTRWLAAHPHLAARFAVATRETAARVTGPFASHARRGWAPGAALVGDAADFFDPFTGEGIYSALRGGELLAPFVAEAVARPAMADRALAGYDSARRRAFRGKWAVERLIGLAVGTPPIMNHVARVLARRQDMADLLVGVAGDFVPPREVFRPAYLLALLVPRLSRP